MIHLLNYCHLQLASHSDYLKKVLDKLHVAAAETGASGSLAEWIHHLTINQWESYLPALEHGSKETKALSLKQCSGQHKTRDGGMLGKGKRQEELDYVSYYR